MHAVNALNFVEIQFFTQHRNSKMAFARNNTNATVIIKLDIIGVKVQKKALCAHWPKKLFFSLL